VNRIDVIGPRLKQAREEQNLSIEEIAWATKINKNFLTQIEEGILPPLPASYVQAFIKAYAQHVHVVLGAWDLLDDDEREQRASHKGVTAEVRHPDAFGIVAAASRASQQGRILAALSAGILILLVGILFIIRQSRTTPAVSDTSFDEVTSEYGSHYANQQLPFVADSSSFWKGTRVDSLVLDAVASDTVWVRISIDGGWTREFDLLPGSRVRWKGRESFLLSLGDGGAISFALNNKSIGILGKAQRPLWNARVDRSLLGRAPSTLRKQS